MRVRLGPWPARLRRLDPRLVDAVLAAILLIVGLVSIYGSGMAAERPWRLVLAVALSAGVAVRRRWLLQALTLIVLLTAVVSIVHGLHRQLGPSGADGSLLALLLFYGAGAYLSVGRAMLGLALGVALLTLSTVTAHQQVAANLVWNDAVLAGLPWLVGRLVRSRAIRARLSRERAERLDSEREMHARVAALAERARLAREIHDVIAHSVSVMVIQAAGARSVMDGDPGRAQDALLTVEGAGREALAEMRRLLGVLGDGAQLRELAPQPGLANLDELVARIRTGGLDTSITVSGKPVAVPPGLSLCAYRVVQEALTNTIKHAGATTAVVSVRWHDDVLELEVADDGHGLHGGVRIKGGGHGIIGMRERAAIHGGVVVTGPLPGGGFGVRARIPLVQAVAA